MEHTQLSMEHNQTLVFAVNGERVELTSVDPSTTLLHFLRSHTRFKSVKLACGQGGCGACNVLLSKFNTKETKNFGAVPNPQETKNFNFFKEARYNNDGLVNSVGLSTRERLQPLDHCLRDLFLAVG